MDGASPAPADDPMMGGDPMMDDPAMGGDPMTDGQPPMEGGEGDDSTMSIINQLSDEDREAVRAYAESMLNNNGGNSEEPMDAPQDEPIMESVIFSKKQLRTIMEGFGPSEDEIQNKKHNVLNKKHTKTASSKSPFNAPKFN